MARNVGADGFMRQQRAAMGRPDSRPLLKQIRCKTLVVCGREDQVTPADCSEEMASGIAQAELVILEQCGHMAPLEQPKSVNEALSHWVNSVLIRQQYSEGSAIALHKTAFRRQACAA